MANIFKKVWRVIQGTRTSGIWDKGDCLKDANQNAYVIEKELGAGGFGVTYLARKNRQHLVVLKTLNLRAQRERQAEKFKQDLRDEAINLSRFELLHSPNIVKCEGLLEIKGLPCLVMQYVEGETLAEKSPLSPASAVTYIRKVATALALVHQYDVIHRDIKPDNIILEKSTNEPILVDFGTARSFRTQETLTGFTSGGFTAPEQGYGDKQGAYTDIYSLGMTFYSLLTGDSNPEIANLVFPSNVSSELEAAIKWAIQRKPEQRPQTINDWLDKLPQPQHEDSRVIVVSQQQNLYTRQQTERHPLKKVAVVGVGVLVIGWGGVSAWTTFSQPKEVSLSKELGELENSSSVESSSSEASMYYEQAIIYHQSGKLEEALEHYNQAIALDPSYAAAYYWQGNIYNQQGKLEDAIDSFTQSLQATGAWDDKQPADAYTARGVVYQKLREYEKAIEDCNEAIRLNPETSLAYANRGYIHKQLEQYETAIKDYNEALRLDPNDAVTQNNRGNAYYELGQYEKALSDYNEAIRIDPNDPLPYNNRGMIYNERGEFQKAINNYNEALRVKADHASAYYNRGIAYHSLEEYIKAIDSYTQSLQASWQWAEEGPADAYTERGWSYYELGQYQRAIEDYNQALDLDPTHVLAYNRRGLSYLKLEKYERAIADYNQCLRIDPNYAHAYYNRARSYEKLENRLQAISDYRRASELYQQQGNQEGYQAALDKISRLQ